LHVVRRPPHRRSGRHSARFIRKGRPGARSLLLLQGRLGARFNPKGRPGARPIIGLLLVAGVTLAGVGVNAARAETPAHKIARLRSQAAEAQAAIDHMNDQVETVVEEFNANHEALQATLDRQRDTGHRLEDARKRLGGAESLMGDRMRAIYMGGPVTGLEQMLEVRSVADAVTVAQYQESASDSDVQAIDAVRQRRQELDSVAADLNGQRREQEQLQARLDGQRRDIQSKLAQQRDYLARLGTDVKRAVAEEQQRQEELQRQALARKLAADKAREQAAREAALKAQRDKAAKDAAAQASASVGSGSSASSSGGSGSGGSGSGGSGSGGSSSGSRHGSTGNPSSASPAPTSAASQAVIYAKAQLGKPYVWSAEGPNSFDCSGLTMTAWRSAGVSIPRVAAAQYGMGRHISRSALEPGDLVFFGSPIHHVGMYVGGGMMIEAPYTGQVVRYHTIDRSDYAGATRPTG
jgi:peptidoglycan DL-endopeptidase CwlO